MPTPRVLPLAATIRRALAATALVGIAATPALAQQAPPAPAADEALEGVVVTGTRIRGAGVVSNSPIATLDAEDLRLQGVANIEDSLRSLPQAVPGRTTYGSAADGLTTVDLRGLGETRTMVLVDGTRWIPTGTEGVVDLNTIPTALVERVEVVTGGASAVYGSDAMAGVVNFILKDDFEGAELSVNYRATDRRDGDTLDVSALLGGNFGDGRGNAVVWLNYTDREEIFQDARPYSAVALGVSGNRIVPSGSTSAFPANVVLSRFPGSNATFGPNGELIAAVTNYNTAPLNYFQVPQRRYQGGGLASFDIGGGAELFGRVAFANNEVSTQLAPSATFFRTFSINPDNPFVPQATIDAFRIEAGAAAIAANGGNIPLSIGYRYSTPRNQRFTRTSFQVQTGVRGDVGTRWNYEAYGQYSRTELQRYLTGDADQARTQQALLVRRGPNGVQCIDPRGGCVPLNIWTSNRGDVTQAALDFIALNLSVMGSSTEAVVGANLSGRLGEALRSPFATDEIAVSVGAEWREVSAENLPDEAYRTGRSSGFSSDSVVIGGFDVAEAYAEARIPLVQGKPFAHAIGLELGYRFSDYSNNADQVSTYKLGGDWSPVADLRFRGMYQRAVRAPNVIELFRPQVESSPTGVDPCAGPNPIASEALCLATGVPAGRYGTVPVPPAGGQFFARIGGNPNLEAEESDTWTVGVVYTPEWLDGLNASVDWYSIEITGAIAQLAGGAPNVLQACYVTTRDANSVYCRAIARSRLNGALFGASEAAVTALSVNTGLLKTTGFDVGLDYRFDLGAWGTLSTGLAGSYVTSFQLQGDPVLDTFECAGRFGSICGNVRPDLRLDGRVTWQYEDATLSLRARHVGGMEFDAVALGRRATFPTPTVGSHTYFDLEGGYDLGETVRLNAGVTNLLDKDPPIVVGTGGTGPTANTFPGIYDPLGRFVHARVTVRF